jgi:competence protein ComEC
MNEKVIPSIITVIIGFIGLLAFQIIQFSDYNLKIVFCDVGQGDATYIRTPQGKDILIDGGPDNSVLLCLSDNMPFWDKELDLVILTHPDSDHYSGLLSVAREYKIKSFSTSLTPEDAPGYKNLHQILREQRVEERFVCNGDNYSFPDGVVLEIVWPKSCDVSSTDKNDNSVISLLSYGDFKALITGDAEEHIGNFYQDRVGDIDILRVPHHGSRDGVDDDYLESIKPEVAIISVGAKNRYGHPVQEILDILKLKNIQILRTDQVGEIRISSDGKSYSVNSDL